MQHRRFTLEKEKQIPVNWRRGMLRLWVLASSAWLMGWLIYFAIKFLSGELPTGQLVVAPVVLLGPPLALLLFGLAARWAFQGFYGGDEASGGQS
jgi:hypothetical protein